MIALEPLADVSIFPTYLVSQLARQHVTVVLSGDGGDELFAGYDWYVAAKLARYYRLVPAAMRTCWLPRVISRLPPTAHKKGLINKLKRFVEGAALSDALQHYRWNIFLTDETRGQLYSKELQRAVEHLDGYSRVTAYLHAFEAADPLWQQQFADIKTFLADDILFKVDRMSMANSLEARTPYLDYRVVEFVAGLPSHLKLRGLQTKYLLKQCMASKLPHEILTRPKEGFSIPMKNWLRQELRPLMQDVLSPSRLQREGLFNAAYVEKLQAEHLQGKANHSHQLWALMVFEIWRDTYRI
jgi:asparagine synthase (glutamine-hydrolysing)